MKSKLFGFFLFLLGFSFSLKAESPSFNLEADSALFFEILAEAKTLPEYDAVSDQLSNVYNSKLALKYHKAFQENKRLTAAMLTFALGMLGVHRLYLGTQPWIPAVYLFTFGGGFLILPVIDLGVILFCKDLSKYEHNDKVLMWVK